MELEDLKNIWKKQNSNFTLRNEAEISAMLKGTSQSIISKLKRSVWFELSATIVAGVGMLVYALTLPNGALKWTSIAIPLVFVMYGVYYIKKLILLNNFNPAGDNVRENIEKLVDNLTTYLRFYKRSYTILFPVYFALGIIFRLLEVGTSRMVELLSQTKTILLLIGTAALFYAASTFVVDWLLKKLYGNHLEKLRTLLKDLHEKADT
jgi:hypothetical protein